MKFTSYERMVSEIYDRTIEGNEAVYWETDSVDDNGNAILMVGAEPVKEGVKFYVAVTVDREKARNGIPRILEESPFIDEINDAWFTVNTKTYDAPVVSLSELTFSHYEDGQAFYSKRFNVSAFDRFKERFL